MHWLFATLARFLRLITRSWLFGSQRIAANSKPTQPSLVVEALEPRIAPATLYVGKSGNYTITTDVGPAGLSAGDTVTWSPGVGTVFGASIPNLIFGTNAFQTISDALNAATSGDTIDISAGTFSESAHISQSVTLHGAQWGVPGETRSVPRSAETILTGAGNNGITPVDIAASNVTLDGFIVEGQTNVNVFGAAIYLHPGTSGSVIQNNIIQNNVVGIFLANDSATAQTVIQHNLFRDNTNPGAGSGQDIYADNYTAGSNLQNVLIQNNTFTNTTFQENSWGVAIANTGTTSFTNISVLNNHFGNAGRGAYFYGSSNVNFSGNTVDGATHYALGIFGSNGTPSNSGFTIDHNTVTNSAIAFEIVDNSNPGTAYSGTLAITNTTLSNTATGVLNSSNAPLSVGATSIGSGNVTIQSDTVNFTGGPNSVTGSGTLTFIPLTPNASIGINGAPGTLQITNADLLALNTTGPNAITGVIFGDAAGADPIQYDTTSSYVFNVPVTFESPGAGGSVHIYGSHAFATTGAGSSITIYGSGHSTTLATDLVTAGAPIAIHDGVILAGDIRIDTTNAGGTSGGADIGIDGAIDSDAPTSAHSLTLSAGSAGHITLQGPIGGLAALGNLTIASAAAAALNGGSVTTSGTQTYSAPVVLGANTTFTASAGAVAFNSTVDGPYTLTVSAGGDVNFSGAAGGTSPLAALTVSGNNISTGAVTTAGQISLTAQNAVTLNGAVNAGASTVSILANQDGTGAQGFTQNAGGSITTTNNTAAAVSIIVNTASGGTGVATLGAINTGLTGGLVTVNANGGAIANGLTGSSVNIHALAAVLEAAGGIGSSSAPINTTITKLEALTATGEIDINENGALTIGGISALNGISAGSGNVRITSSGALTIAEDISTTGNVNLSSGGSITETTGIVTANSLTTASVGGQTLKGDSNGVRRNAVAAFSATNTGTGSAILFLNKSSGTLSVGNVSNPVGSVTAGGLNANGDNILIDNIGNIDITGTVTSGSTAPVVLGGQITINSSGTLHITSTGRVQTLAGTGGTLTLSSNVVMDGGITAGLGNVTLSGGAGTLTVNAPISVPSPLVLRNADDIIINAAVATTSATSDLTVIADYDGNSAGGVEVTANGLLNAGHNLIVSGSDLESTVGIVDGIRLDGNGSVTQVTALGDILLSVNNTAPTGSEIWVGGMVSGGQTGSITFNSNVHLFGTTAAVVAHGAGNILFAGTVNGNSPLALQTDFGQVTFNAAVGNNIPVGDVVVKSALNVVANSSFSGSSLTILSATGAATFNGPVTLTGPNTNFAVSGNQLNIESTVNANGGNMTWTVNGIDISGNVSSANGFLTIQPLTLNQTIGINATGGLSLTAAEIGHLVDGFASIQIGNQLGTGAVTVGVASFSDPVSIISPGGALSVTGSITGTDNASVVLWGKTISLGVASPSAAISTQSNPINLTGNVTLTANTQLLTNASGTGADITIDGMINGGYSLNIQAGTAGSVNLEGTHVAVNASIGGSTLLSSLTVSGKTINLQPQILTSGLQTYTATSAINMLAGGLHSQSGGLIFNGPVVLSNNINLASQNSPITFNGTVDNIGSGATGALSITNPGGTVTFNGAVGGAHPLAFANVASANSVTVKHGFAVAGDITFTANQTDLLGGAGSVSGPGTITFQTVTSGVGVHVGGTANVAGNLSLTTGDIAALANGFQSIVIARSGGNAGLTIDSTTGATFDDPVTFRQASNSSAVSILGPLIGTDNASFMFPGQTVNFAANITTAGGFVNFGTGLISNDVTISTSGGDIIARSKMLDSGGGHNVTMNAGTGNIELLASVGTSALGGAFGSIKLTSSGVTTLIGTIIAKDFSAGGGGSLALHSTVHTSGVAGQTYSEPVTLNSSLSIATAGAPVHFLSSIDSAAGKVYGVSINAGLGDISLDSNLGATSALSSVTLTSKGTIAIGGNVNSKSMKLASHDFAIKGVTTTEAQSYTGLSTFSGPLSGTTLSIKTTSDVTNSGAWTFTGQATISATGHAVQLTGANSLGILKMTAGAATIDVIDNIDLSAVTLPGNLTLNAGGDIGQTAALKATSVTITSGGAVSLTNASNVIQSLAGISAQTGVTVLSGGANLTLDGTTSTVLGDIEIASDSKGSRHNVINHMGANAFHITGGGRWIIFSYSSRGTSLSGLTIQYAETLHNYYPYNPPPTAAGLDSAIFVAF